MAEPSAVGSAGPDRGAPGRGVQVGRYLLLARVGSGGMGEVWAAYDPELDRRVAVKLLAPGHAVGSSGPRERLLREAQALARLAHPNVLTVHDVGTWGEQVFIATELLDGVTVREWLREQPRGWRAVVAVFLAAGEGLAAAHRAGLVHRDVKPDNVLLLRDGRVKVLDFGLARAVGEGEADGHELDSLVQRSVSPQPRLATPLTEDGSIPGTLPYMAPEQLSGAAPDARSDQFGFTVALFEALCGERPFQGATASALIQALASEPPGEPPRWRQIPAWVRRVVLRGLARRPSDRFPSMDRLLAALRQDPTRRWRRAVLAAALLVVGGLLAWWAVAEQRLQAQRCGGGVAQLAAVWDATTSERGQRAFTATGLPFAAEAWRLVAAAVDRYSRGWTAMHREACETTQRGEQSAALLDQRMLCLQQRLQELDGLVDTFARADPKVVENAAAAVASLTPLAACADLRVLGGLAPLPGEPHRRAQLERASALLARAQALRRAGRNEQALALARRGLLEARSLGYPPLLAEAHLVEGEVLRLAGQPDAAATTLAEALFVATAHRHEEVAAKAAVALVYVSGYQQQRPQELAVWARLAAASLQRTGEAYPRARHELHNNLGLAALSAGRFADAQRHFDDALASVQRATGDSGDPLLLATTFTNLGGVHFYQGRVAESLPYFERALALRRGAQGEAHPRVAEAINNLGSVAVLAGDYPRARRLLEEALVRKRALVGDGHADLASSLNNLAEVLRLAGSYDEAEARFREALAIWQRTHGPDSPWVAEALDGLGALENDRGRGAAALQHHRQALAIRRARHGADHPRLAYSLTGEGRALVALGQPREAIAPLRRALSLREAASSERGELAETRFALARALDGAGQPGAALALARQAAADYAATGSRFPTPRAELAAWLATRDPGTEPGSR